jgi:hypothetical protein
MYELALLSLLNSMRNWGTAPVIATRTVVADVPTLHALLRDDGGEARLIAGIDPRLRPHALLRPSRDPHFLHAQIRFGGRDVLCTTWLLTPNHGTTDVDLAAQLASRAIVARLALLACRRPLRGHLEAVLAELAVDVRRTAEDLTGEASARRPTVPAAPHALRGRDAPATVDGPRTGLRASRRGYPAGTRPRRRSHGRSHRRTATR